MKVKFKRIATLLTFATLVLGGGAVVGTTIDNGQASIKETIAVSDNVTKNYVHIRVEDQINWTSMGKDPVLHIWNITFIEGSGYTDITQVNASHFGWTVNSDKSIDVTMSWYTGSNSYRHYEYAVPWFIDSFTYKYHRSETGGPWIEENNPATLNNKYNDYIYGNTSNPGVSHTSGSGETASIPYYAITYYQGSTVLGSKEALQYAYYTADSSIIVPNGYVLDKWYKDSELATEYSSSTLTGNLNLYGKYNVTAVSVSAFIKEKAGGWNNPVSTGNCTTNYTDSKALVVQMSTAEKTTFQNGTAGSDIYYAYITYTHWCTVNGDDQPFASANIAPVGGTIAVEPAITTLIIVSIIGVTAVGAFFFYRKKKSSIK